MSLNIDIRDSATPFLRRISMAILPVNINPMLARAATEEVRRNYFELEKSHPNKPGFPRQHFWAECANSTHYVLLPVGFVISVNQVGAALQYYGGTVKPGKNPSSYNGKPTRFLTIPATAEAYGHRAGEFNNLHFEVTDRGPALVTNQATVLKKSKKTGKYKSGGEVGGKVMYWLARKVNVPALPETLPTASSLFVVMDEAFKDLLASKI